MSPDDDKDALPMLAYRMAQMERELDEFRKALERFSERVDKQFASLNAHIGTLAFVPLALYERDRGGLDKELTAIRADAENARKVAWGAVVVLVTAVVGAVVAIAVQAAG